MTSTINFLRLLADPTRLRLLLLLEQEELSVAELQGILGMGQSRISSHLAQLKRAGAVADRRAGKNVYYGLTKKEERNSARGPIRELMQTLAREVAETARDRTALKVTLRQAQDHANKPERAIQSGHRILKKNGRVVVLDLLSHRFEKARELYADHWLGFSEVRLHELLERTGFREIEISVVAREKQSPQFQTVFATGVK